MRYKKTIPHLFIAPLPNDKIEIPESSKKFNCLFIVQHTEDVELIRKHAINLFSEGCFCFSVFGSKWNIWQNVLDQVQDEMFPEPIVDSSATTSWYTVDQFCEYLDSLLDSYPSWNEDCYLFYDDERTMMRVLKRLKEITGPYPWE